MELLIDPAIGEWIPRPIGRPTDGYQSATTAAARVGCGSCLTPVANSDFEIYPNALMQYGPAGKQAGDFVMLEGFGEIDGSHSLGILQKWIRACVKQKFDNASVPF